MTVTVCLVFVAPSNKAVTQVKEQAERKTGSTIRGVVTYADTGRPLRFSTVLIINNATGKHQMQTVSDGRGQFV